jgi:hypothetical protein
MKQRQTLLLMLIVVSISAALPGSEFYGGAWALRCDSDARVSFSWIGAWYDSESQWQPFIEPMIGLSASGIYAGLWRDLESDPVHLRNHRHARIRPKIGIIRTYNDPWVPDEQEWYGYAGVELGLSEFFLGINMQAGMLIGEESYPSIGVGFGF